MPSILSSKTVCRRDSLLNTWPNLFFCLCRMVFIGLLFSYTSWLDRCSVQLILINLLQIRISNDCSYCYGCVWVLQTSTAGLGVLCVHDTTSAVRTRTCPSQTDRESAAHTTAPVLHATANGLKMVSSAAYNLWDNHSYSIANFNLCLQQLNILLRKQAKYCQK